MPEDVITAIATIIAAVIGVGGAGLVVNRWQKRKDLSEIRKGILHNYTISFKNHVNLMDNFVGELVMSYGKFSNPQPSTTAPRIVSTTNRKTLSHLLPWGYTYKDLEHYSQETGFDNLKDWEGKKNC